MVVSVNTIATPNEFNALLTGTVNTLNNEAKLKPDEIRNLAGNRLEPFVKEIMDQLAIGTPFANSIELISGQKFPDIVAKKYYGIEVKSTTSNNWKSTGNSVKETTRVDGVERIFMLFGKLGNPIQFMSRPYEECLSEVVVTHSPRYLIDMELKPGETIFDKMKISYNDLRTQNPIKVVKEYYRQIARNQGNDVWWIDDNSQTEYIIKIWSSLTNEQKNEHISKGMVFFPEIFSNSNTKFNRFATWLTTHKNIICPNIRDLFTSGGKVDIMHSGTQYRKMPRIVFNMYQQLSTINQVIINTPADTLNEYWGIKTTENKKNHAWQSLVLDNLRTIIGKRAEEVNQLFITK